MNSKRVKHLEKQLEIERAEEPPPTQTKDKTFMKRYIPKLKHIQGYNRQSKKEDKRSHYLFILIMAYIILGFI